MTAIYVALRHGFILGDEAFPSIQWIISSATLTTADKTEDASGHNGHDEAQRPGGLSWRRLEPSHATVPHRLPLPIADSVRLNRLEQSVLQTGDGCPAGTKKVSHLFVYHSK